MADWYVVAGAAGGGSGTTYANAFNTVAAAYTAASDGDRIILDGLLVGSAFQCGGATGYALIDKALTFISYTDHSATVAPSVVTAAFNISNAAYAKALVLGDINIAGADVAGGTTPNYAVWSQSTAAHSITLNSTRMTNAVFYGINIGGTAAPITLSATDVRFEIASGARSFLSALSLGTGSSVTLTRPYVRMAAKNHASFIIDIAGSVSTPTIRVVDQDIEYTNAVAAGFHGVTRVLNINNVVVQGGSLRANGAATGAVAYGTQIDCTSGSLTAHNARIDSVIHNMNEGLGIAALIGHDAADATSDNRSNNGLIRNCTVRGTAAFQTGFGHGLMLGNNTGGQIAGGSSDLLGIGALTKQTTDTAITGVTVTRCNSAFLYFKGATRARAQENKLYAGTGVAPVFQAAVGDNATNTTGSYFGDNDISITGSASKLYNVTTSQVVTFGQNRFWQAPGSTIANPAASITGTDYTTLALALAAIDTNAQTTTTTGVIPSAQAQGVAVGGLSAGVAQGVAVGFL